MKFYTGSSPNSTRTSFRTTRTLVKLYAGETVRWRNCTLPRLNSNDIVSTSFGDLSTRTSFGDPERHSDIVRATLATA
jgi:hypothetical protein